MAINNDSILFGNFDTQGVEINLKETLMFDLHAKSQIHL